MTVENRRRPPMPVPTPVPPPPKIEEDPYAEDDPYATPPPPPPPPPKRPPQPTSVKRPLSAWVTFYSRQECEAALGLDSQMGPGGKVPLKVRGGHGGLVGISWHTCCVSSCVLVMERV